MWKNLFNFDGINWWTFLGGTGMNFIISIMISLVGAFLGSNESTAGFYAQYGPPLNVLAIFVACLCAGYITGKIAYQDPLKHAFLTSLGAFVPFTISGLMTLNPMLLMAAAVAVAGNFNGGMLATPKPKGPRFK